MNLRTLLSVYAVLIGIGGLIWLLVPAQNLGLYGITAADPVAVVLGRFAGTMGIGLAVIAWGARGASASPARNALVLGITVANALGAIVCLLGALSGAFNNFAWVPVVAYAVFTVLFIVAGRGSMAEKQAVAAGR